MLRYTLRQLEHALAVLDKGSVAGAAQALGVAQPSISASLAKLEDQIGIRLFIRHHAQGVTATPQGLRFLAAARSLVDQAQDLERETAAAGTAIAGTLAVGSFTTIASAHAPQLIAGFTARHPRTAIRLEETTQDRLIEALRGGRHDVALLYNLDLPDDLSVTDLAAFAPYLLLPAGHRLAAKRRIALPEVAGEPLVLLDVAPSRAYFTRLLASAGIAPRIAFSSPSLEVVRGLVGRGLGYSILITRPFGDRSYAGDALAARPIAGTVENGIVALAVLRQMRKTRLVMAFEDYCVEYFRSPEKRL
jgi:DNA-binding transcriptional LysR family regulator